MHRSRIAATVVGRAKPTHRMGAKAFREGNRRVLRCGVITPHFHESTKRGVGSGGARVG